MENNETSSKIYVVGGEERMLMSEFFL